jgi:hypothetical protein
MSFLEAAAQKDPARAAESCSTLALMIRQLVETADGKERVASWKRSLTPGLIQGNIDIAGLEAAERHRLEYAKDYFAKHPNAVRPEIQKAVLAQRVVEDMCPTEAQLAAGQFVYSVKNDPKWPESTMPLRIIHAQCSEPDSSEITMTFMTRTQFDDKRLTSFKVSFRNGKAVSIERGRTVE